VVRLAIGALEVEDRGRDAAATAWDRLQLRTFQPAGALA
jgi:hypothetical protein